MSDLKPCPFCGAPAELKRYGSEDKYAIKCTGCPVELRWYEPKDKQIANWNRRTQPEATAPAQDLSAAILAMDCPDTSHYGVSKAVGYEQAWDECRRAAAALASPANALSVGDRVDAERLRAFIAEPRLGYRWRLQKGRHQWQAMFDGETVGKWGEFREVIDTAILQSQKGGSHG